VCSSVGVRVTNENIATGMSHICWTGNLRSDGAVIYVDYITRLYQLQMPFSVK
jgi:hypothetical protein